jgi:hypothetical protein
MFKSFLKILFCSKFNLSRRYKRKTRFKPSDYALLFLSDVYAVRDDESDYCNVEKIHLI